MIYYLRGHNEDTRVYIENKNVYGLLEVANKLTCMDGEWNFIAKSRDDPVIRELAHTHECIAKRLS